MKWSQQLNYINNYLNKLTTFQKVEIYLIPIILGVVLIYNFPLIQNNDIVKQSDSKDLKYYQIKKEQLLNKINSSDSLEIVKSFEEFIKDKDLTITSTKVSNQILFVDFEAEFKDAILFINYCENYNDTTKIENFTAYKIEKNKIKVSMNLSFSKVIRTKDIESNLKEINSLKNPFIKNVINDVPKLSAIVNNNALINDKWYTIGDTFGKYKVEKISHDIVELNSDENIMQLELFKK